MASTPQSLVPLGKPRGPRRPSSFSKLGAQIDTNRQGQEGVAWVRWIVEGLWGCGLEVVSANNDDGVDAMVLLKRRQGMSKQSGPTGDLLFVQIKTGYIEKIPLADYSLRFDVDKMARWRSRWASYPGPALMVHVIPRRITNGEPQAFWTDLKTFDSADPQKVSFTYRHKFDVDAKSDIYNLCWRWSEFRKLPVIQAPQSLALLGGGSLSEVAWDFFKGLRASVKASRSSFKADVSRTGWDHITRPARPVETKQQSLLLLPVAELMLCTTSGLVARPVTDWRVKHPSVNLPTGSFIGPLPSTHKQIKKQRYEVLMARVTFYERHEAIVCVVLQKTQLWSNNGMTHEAIVFYSVYEVARRRNSP